MKRATSWLSHDLTALVQAKPHIAAATRPAEAPAFDFDVVIVGSGYGGAVAAAGLVGRGLEVCVLERGREYLGGSFPSRLSDLAGHVRFSGRESARSSGEQTGLFDLRLGGDVTVLVANGVGGGSLINAGVMEPPLAAVFEQPRWPTAIRAKPAVVLAGVDAMRRRLGAAPFPTRPAKTLALMTLGTQATCKPLHITVAGADGHSAAGVQRAACIGCGDCATGCNHEAKDSLDVNLLRQAARAGALVYSGATVLKLQRPDSGVGWELELNHTAAILRARQKEPFRLRAARVILAAGTLGSTEILMRSKSDTLAFSQQLGKHFSANGDMVAAVHDMDRRVKAVSREDTAPGDRGIGPTITMMVDERRNLNGMVVQDLAVPAALQRLYEESFVVADVLAGLAVPDTSTHGADDHGPDPAAVQRKAFDGSLVVAVIGHDEANGTLVVPAKALQDPHTQGVLGVDWKDLKQSPALTQRQGRLAEMAARAGNGGRTLANPMWQPLPDTLEEVLGAARGPLLTVHPLGGCCMADDVLAGVVDDAGRVFDPRFAAGPTHRGLYVLDGAIVPTSLGINPALTIALLAERALRTWEADGDIPGLLHERPVARSETRPRFAVASTAAAPARPTQIEVIERLRGRVRLIGDETESAGHLIELTLRFGPAPVAALFDPDADQRTLTVSAPRGRLRIAKGTADPACGEFSDDEIEFESRVSGSMRLLGFESSTPMQRRARALQVWLRHRAVRDFVQKHFGKDLELANLRPHRLLLALNNTFEGAQNTCNLLSHVGAARLLEYTLQVEDPVVCKLPALNRLKPHWPALQGTKRFVYEDRANPWQQLSTLWLKGLPGQAGDAGAELRFDTRYAARIGVPLLRVTDQQDRPAALMDLASLALYVMRVAVQVHALSFRKPDAPKPDTVDDPIRRLPGTVDGLPEPESTCSWIDPTEAKALARLKGKKAAWRLTRYRKPGVSGSAANPPVLLIHGYSASGTSFAHNAIDEHLVGVLCEAGRDAWVLDMRSSAGMDSATFPWRFEDMAEHDIPRAVDMLCRITGSPTVDVVAHCMGAAMFSMALLYKNGVEERTDAEVLRADMHKRIGRVVFSQVGPLLQLSPDNTLRAYVMNYVRTFLPLEDYSFRKQPDADTPVSNDLLDRILTTLPYPKEEFELENPPWSLCSPPKSLGQQLPWVGTRHRIDALYARTFRLANMSAAVLDKIDDFFGPLSVETASQVIHFAQRNTITDVKGRNYWTAPERLAERFRRPVLMLCGQDNGLVDPATLDHMDRGWVAAGLNHLRHDHSRLPSRDPRSPKEMHALIENNRGAADASATQGSLMTWLVPGFGHQDCLIGEGSGAIHRVIEDFLRRDGETP